MTGNDYQKLAARTIPTDKSRAELTKHALFGMVGEIGEIHSIYQKQVQGHDINYSHLKKEVGDLTWFIAEFCTVNGWDLSEIMGENIAKLIARYPEGFSSEKSLHRKEGDI
jgi:NTP pyrophosphatase (non-canonical NTP hydrolase)